MATKRKFKTVFKLQAHIEVHDKWIEDGFDLESRKAEIDSLIRDLLPHATQKEMVIRVKVKKRIQEVN